MQKRRAGGLPLYPFGGGEMVGPGPGDEVQHVWCHMGLVVDMLLERMRSSVVDVPGQQCVHARPRSVGPASRACVPCPRDGGGVDLSGDSIYPTRVRAQVGVGARFVMDGRPSGNT